MGDVARPFFLRRQAFAQVMQQAGPAHGEWLLVACGLFQRAQCVRARVDFRMMGLWLRHAEQGIDFWHQFFESAAGPQYFNEHLWLIFHQGTGDFFPDAFRGQRLQFT